CLCGALRRRGERGGVQPAPLHAQPWGGASSRSSHEETLRPPFRLGATDGAADTRTGRLSPRLHPLCQWVADRGNIAKSEKKNAKCGLFGGIPAARLAGKPVSGIRLRTSHSLASSVRPRKRETMYDPGKAQLRFLVMRPSDPHDAR